jgi:hypothetical protein
LPGKLRQTAESGGLAEVVAHAAALESQLEAETDIEDIIGKVRSLIELCHQTQPIQTPQEPATETT